MILVIARREWQRLFLSPLAWSTLAISQFVLGVVFITQVQTYLRFQSPIQAAPPGLGVTAWIGDTVLEVSASLALVVTPLITMGLFAGERQGGTMPLLAAAPVSPLQLLLGKYLGALTFLITLALLSLVMLMSLAGYTDLIASRIAVGFGGLLLVLAVFAAAGAFFSSLTAHPPVAAFASFGLLLILWLFEPTTPFGIPLSEAASNRAVTGTVTDWLRWLALGEHFRLLNRGWVSVSAIASLMLQTTLFLGLAWYRLDADRRPH